MLDLDPPHVSTLRSIYDYFQQAGRRPKNTEACTAGELVPGSAGNTAIFYLEATKHRITKVVFRCTSCMTLVALCEHLSELALGLGAGQAEKLDPALLLRLHPDIPSYLQNRAELACAALHSAISILKKGNEL
ncbi:MAG: hypothetical protein IT160_06530 [Bryobacterales bacterium]|nr:hypothetical protein [Bryobacterales bacterium]